jgi:PAS domain S-box-containing protein
MFRSQAGEDIPVEVTLVRVPWKGGYRFTSYARDLREIKGKEDRVREAEERLKVMLDNMPFACFFIDLNGNPVDCNQRAVNLFGCESKEVFLETFFLLSPGHQLNGRSSIEYAKELIQSTFFTGKSVFAWEHITTDGAPLPVEVTLIRVDWNDGYRILAYLRDLSKLVETENNLRRVLATAEASPNFTLYLTADGKIEYMNPAVSAVSGVPREELLRDGLEPIFSPEDFKLMSEEYFPAALKGETADFEMTVRVRGGGDRDFSFAAFAVELYDGTTGIGFLGRDITELKELQQQLITAKEQAERALAYEVHYNKAKSDFLNRVSHELKTPMNAITGMAEIAGKSSNVQEWEYYINIIKESAKHLSGIVNDIMDLSNIDTGRFEFIPLPFSFSSVTASVIEIIRPDAILKKQELKADIDPDIPDLIISDERRVRQILIKLLYNAVKFTQEEGKIEFSARLLDNTNNKCTVRFGVKDNGKGIKPETLARIWDIFEQENSSITREYTGMGLGLPLTKRIVKLMDGSLEVETEPGKGSRFICDLHFSIDEAGLPEEGPNNEAVDSSQTADLNGKRILVVDDVEVNREILIIMLEDQGAILEEAANGEEAVNMFMQNKYDLVLMDLRMPVMDGFTAARAIRASGFPGAKTIPIISVSAENSVELGARCQAAGINDHLAKPVEMETLLAMISKWMPLAYQN